MVIDRYVMLFLTMITSECLFFVVLIGGLA
jgi:hypothetical protein